MAAKQNSKTLSTNLHVKRKQNSFGVGLKNDDQLFQQSTIRHNQQAGRGREFFFSGMAYGRGSLSLKYQLFQQTVENLSP